MADLNPKLITFGAQRSVGPNCKVLDAMETNLRFTAQCERKNGEPAYDLIAQIGGAATRPTGVHILLGKGGAVTLGKNADNWLLPALERCHDQREPYLENIQQLTPGLLDGFRSGAICTRDVECRSKTCIKKRCL